MHFVRRHWKGIALGTAIVICLAATIVVVPVALAEPWQPLEAEARAKGLATTAGPLSPPPPPERLAAARRLLAVRTALSLYDHSSLWSYGKDIPDQPPTVLTDPWAKADPERIAEALAAVSELATAPSGSHAESSVRNVYHAGEVRTAERFALQLLAQRWLVADPADADTDGHRMVRLIAGQDRSWYVELPVQPLNALLARGDRLRDPALATRLRQLADALPDQERRAVERRLALCCDLLRDFSGTTRRLGVSRPVLLHNPLSTAVVVRLGGAPLLRDLLEWHAAVVSEPSLPRLLATERRITMARWGRGKTPGSWASRHLAACLGNHLVRTPTWPDGAMRARLVAWRIDGQQWPVDLWDPAAGPLRRIERDGVLVGAYSIGRDSADDGGKPYRDIIFPLVPRSQGGPPTN